MIYNAKNLFSFQKLFDFTKISNMDLYDPEINLNTITPYINKNDNMYSSDEDEDADADADADEIKEKNKDENKNK